MTQQREKKGLTVLTTAELQIGTYTQKIGRAKEKGKGIQISRWHV